MIFATRKLVGLTYEKYLEDPNILTLVSNAMVTYDAGFSVKNGVHIFLYTKTIFNLGRERHQKFVENAANYRDIGCFGLTELLHGSNVKGLLTEAHYDHKNK
jgi:acyl-CoA oxidase